MHRYGSLIKSTPLANIIFSFTSSSVQTPGWPWMRCTSFRSRCQEKWSHSCPSPCLTIRSETTEVIITKQAINDPLVQTLSLPSSELESWFVCEILKSGNGRRTDGRTNGTCHMCETIITPGREFGSASWINILETQRIWLNSYLIIPRLHGQAILALNGD